MGKTAREITNLEIVSELVKAYADEWLAYYLYTFLAQSVNGNLYPQLKTMLEETAKEEYEHAGKLADLIVKLGGETVRDPMTLEENANFPAIVPVGDIDLDNVCGILAESEANAIRIYNALALKTKDSDVAVYSLVSEILSDEIDHEELFENLMGKQTKS